MPFFSSTIRSQIKQSRRSYSRKTHSRLPPESISRHQNISQFTCHLRHRYRRCDQRTACRLPPGSVPLSQAGSRTDHTSSKKALFSQALSFCQQDQDPESLFILYILLRSLLHFLIVKLILYLNYPIF